MVSYNRCLIQWYRSRASQTTHTHTHTPHSISWRCSWPIFDVSATPYIDRYTYSIARTLGKPPKFNQLPAARHTIHQHVSCIYTRNGEDVGWALANISGSTNSQMTIVGSICVCVCVKLPVCVSVYMHTAPHTFARRPETEWWTRHLYTRNHSRHTRTRLSIARHFSTRPAVWGLRIYTRLFRPAYAINQITQTERETT